MKIEGDEQKFIDATWSRSGRRVILTVGPNWDAAQQVELTPDQTKDLARCLSAEPDQT